MSSRGKSSIFNTKLRIGSRTSMPIAQSVVQPKEVSFDHSMTASQPKESSFAPPTPGLQSKNVLFASPMPIAQPRECSSAPIEESRSSYVPHPTEVPRGSSSARGRSSIFNTRLSIVSRRLGSNDSSKIEVPQNQFDESDHEDARIPVSRSIQDIQKTSSSESDSGIQQDARVSNHQTEKAPSKKTAQPELSSQNDLGLEQDELNELAKSIQKELLSESESEVQPKDNPISRPKKTIGKSKRSKKVDPFQLKLVFDPSTTWQVYTENGQTTMLLSSDATPIMFQTIH